MGQRMKLGGKWRALDMFLRVRGVWKAAESVYVKVNGVWRLGQHIHDFIYVSNGAESTHTATCAHCNKTITEGHIYYSSSGRDATCTEDGYELFVCEKCSQQKEVVYKATGHMYEVTDEVAATCLKDGYTDFRCTQCGYEYRKEMPATGNHEWYEHGHENATCTSPGGYYESCYYCDYTRWVHTQDALGHDRVWIDEMECYYCPACESYGV